MSKEKQYISYIDLKHNYGMMTSIPADWLFFREFHTSYLANTMMVGKKDAREFMNRLTIRSINRARVHGPLDTMCWGLRRIRNFLKKRKNLDQIEYMKFNAVVMDFSMTKIGTPEQNAFHVGMEETEKAREMIVASIRHRFGWMSKEKIKLVNQVFDKQYQHAPKVPPSGLKATLELKSKFIQNGYLDEAGFIKMLSHTRVGVMGNGTLL